MKLPRLGWLVTGALFLGGATWIGGGLTIAGGFPITLTGTASTALTLPPSGTVATTANIPAAGQLPGTATNDNASAGNVGQYPTPVAVGAGSAVSISPSATVVNVGTISLTAGDWDCRGNFGINAAASTVVSRVLGGISLTSATLPTSGNPGTVNIVQGFTGANSVTVPIDIVRISVAGTTTVYLVATASFTTSTAGAFGSMSCRRVR